MAINFRNDYRFGKGDEASVINYNNEQYCQIDVIDGWEGYNTKIIERDSLRIKGKSNYLRTCLENNIIQNNVTNRGNSFPFCFSSDLNIEPVTSNKLNGSTLTLPALPRFTLKDGGIIEKASDNDKTSTILTGFQKYICPKKYFEKGETVNFEKDYYVLTKTESNSYWPIRPSNGDGANYEFSPPNPYHARIRIPISDLKYNFKDSDGKYHTLSLTTDESEGTRLVKKIRGYINLVNPDAINATTNATGAYKWPHNYNQIHYRLTKDELGGDEDTPTITILNGECAGNANIGSTNYVNQSSYYGVGVPFEVPVLKDQKYLIFDIYTDVCDNIQFQTFGDTQWWQLTWSFESYTFIPVSNSKKETSLITQEVFLNPETSTDIGTRIIEQNQYIEKEVVSGIFPKENYFAKWVINPNMSGEFNAELYKVDNNIEYKVGADIAIETNNNTGKKNVIVKFRLNYPEQNIKAGQFKLILFAANSNNEGSVSE